MATKTTYGSYSSDLFLQGKVMFTIGSTGGSAYNDPTGLNWSDGVGLAKVPAYKITNNISCKDLQYVSSTLMIPLRRKSLGNTILNIFQMIN